MEPDAVAVCRATGGVMRYLVSGILGMEVPSWRQSAGSCNSLKTLLSEGERCSSCHWKRRGSRDAVDFIYIFFHLGTLSQQSVSFIRVFLQIPEQFRQRIVERVDWACKPSTFLPIILVLGFLGFSKDMALLSKRLLPKIILSCFP